MASRDDFTPAEWNTLANTPEAVCLAVLAAEPGGAVAEMQAFFDAWEASSKQPFAGNQLVLTIIRNRDAEGEEARFQAANRESLSSLPPDSTLEAACQACESAMFLLMAKGTAADRASYREWLYFLAHHVAVASRTGGFLGIGGTALTDAEAHAIEEICSALGA